MVPGIHHHKIGEPCTDRCITHSDIPAVPIVRFDRTDLTPIFDQLKSAIEGAAAAYTKALDQLREAGLAPEEPPTDPQARALWARQNRSTGPARPSGPSARRPRRHQ